MPPPYADFDELYLAHGKRLVLQLFAYTADMPLAQDLVHEAFCRALARWSRISRYDDPIGWVRRVAWNLAATQRRRSRRAGELARGALHPQVNPGPDPDRIALMQALTALPENQRRAVIMHYLGDLPILAIAEIEQVSENTVKQRLHRARISLAARLSDWMPGVGNA